MRHNNNKKKKQNDSSKFLDYYEMCGAVSCKKKNQFFSEYECLLSVLDALVDRPINRIQSTWNNKNSRIHVIIAFQLALNELPLLSYIVLCYSG